MHIHVTQRAICFLMSSDIVSEPNRFLKLPVPSLLLKHGPIKAYFSFGLHTSNTYVLLFYLF